MALTLSYRLPATCTTELPAACTTELPRGQEDNFEEGAKALSAKGEEDARDVPSKADPDPTADARLSIDASCPSDGIPGEVMGADPHSPLFLGRAGDMAVAD